MPPTECRDDHFAGLLEALQRNNKAGLKSSKERKMDKKKANDAAAGGSSGGGGGGSIMDSLANKLKMRRKGISGLWPFLPSSTDDIMRSRTRVGRFAPPILRA